MKRILSLILTCALALSLALPTLAAEPGFADVPADADYAQAVAWCREQGLMNGVSASANRFDPNGTLTRAMVATVLYRAAGEPAVTESPAFTDTRAGQWYSNAVTWANTKDIVRGYGNGLFGTNDPVTREQLDIMIRRYNGEDPVWTGDATLATRAEAAVAFYTNLNKETTAQASKILVAYYSATGSTEAVAETIAETLNGDLFEILPAEPYSSADLNWTNSSSRVNAEHNDPALREMDLVTATPDNWDSYDVVFVGYPIWWGIAAWPVDAFIRANDFEGKTVIPFCTSSSSGLGQSGELLEDLAKAGTWLPGQRFRSSAPAATVRDWALGLELPTAPAEQEGRTLVVYFSMPETTNPNNMTTEEANSTVVINGEVLGNTQYMAQIIQRETNADIFRIEPAVPYPTDHTALVAQARQEQNNSARPALAQSIGNLSDYDTVFVGYPNWWGDMPMILYTFFETHDFAGKTIVPFNTHGGSGFSGTISTIRSLEPQAQVLNGLSISRDRIQDAEQQIVDWVKGLNI